MSEETTSKQLRITLVKSPIGYSRRHKGTVRALGLRKLNQSVTRTDTPQLRGMLARVGFLMEVEEL
ncbi:MAG: 50S ribosomal protein L30 [Chloroflexi bacterium]|nr:50S ribosomal protein L30 [Chloroflexota bacterium]